MAHVFCSGSLDTRGWHDDTGVENCLGLFTEVDWAVDQVVIFLQQMRHLLSGAGIHVPIVATAFHGPGEATVRNTFGLRSGKHQPGVRSRRRADQQRAAVAHRTDDSSKPLSPFFNHGFHGPAFQRLSRPILVGQTLTEIQRFVG